MGETAGGMGHPPGAESVWPRVPPRGLAARPVGPACDLLTSSRGGEGGLVTALHLSSSIPHQMLTVSSVSDLF